MPGEVQSNFPREEAAPPELERRLAELYHKVRRWASLWTNSPDEAEDLTQEAMLRVYTRLESYRGEARIESWAYRVTWNVAVSRWRRAEVRERAEGRYTWDRVDVTAWDPLDEVVATDLIERICGRSSALSGGRKRAIEMVCVDGLSAVEVGLRAGVAASTVRSLVCRARMELRVAVA